MADLKRRFSPLGRREFFRRSGAGILLCLAGSARTRGEGPAPVLNDIFSIDRIPDDPYYLQDDHHSGLDALLYLMGSGGLKFYRTAESSPLGGPRGLIAFDDVVLIKVNAQWKHRGCTNSDLVRGLVRRILDNPEAFTGEVVIVENGQGRGSLRCDTFSAYGDDAVRANANDGAHSFQHLVDHVFRDPRVSSFLLDPVRTRFITADDHRTDGYRRFENVSYPCFTTSGGHRVELKEGIWRDGAHRSNLKLINVPVLKHHDVGGSEITACLKHVYGLVSMADGMSGFRHYAGLGETCGKMMAAVRTPVLNIIDAVWVAQASITGYPEETTRRLNRIVASQDPVALDRWAAADILFPIDRNPRHHPDHPNIRAWLGAARDTINARGGLADPGQGIVVGRVTDRDDEARIFSGKAFSVDQRVLAVSSDPGGTTDPEPGVYPLARGAQARIAALARPGFRFDGWRGDIQGRANPGVVRMDVNRTVRAVFERIPGVPPSRIRR